VKEWGYVRLQLKLTPDYFIEAARIDGAGEVWISFKIMAPLNRSIMAIIVITTFNGIWDNFIWPLIVFRIIIKCPSVF